MPHRPILIAVALLFAIGLPLYYVVIKRRAAASLEALLAERFRARACPIADKIEVPDGGRVACQAAYDDTQGTGLVLILGSWDRGTIKVPSGISHVENRVAGVFKPGADSGWLERARQQADVIVAAQAAGGGLVVWKGLPSHGSVLAHIEALR